MADPERPTPPSDLVPRLQSLLLELQRRTREIEDAEAARRRTWSDVSRLVNEYGVPEEAKFAVAAFRGHPTDPEKNSLYVERLIELDKQIKAFAGEILAWLTSEVVETSHPFNPAVKPDTEKRVTLHVGLLPAEASLVVEAHGKLSIPIEKSVAIPVSSMYMPDERLFIDDELIPIGAEHGNSFELESSPGLDLAQYGIENPYPIVLGNKTVQLLLDKNSLGKHPQVTEALETLAS
jgi:hypothetical protein